MKHSYTWDKRGNLYYANQLNSKWCLVVCRTVGVKDANAFLVDNHDCSVLADFGNLILIGFTDDLGKEKISFR